jgi:hypothetical protein
MTDREFVDKLLASLPRSRTLIPEPEPEPNPLDALIAEIRDYVEGGLEWRKHDWLAQIQGIVDGTNDHVSGLSEGWHDIGIDHLDDVEGPLAHATELIEALDFKVADLLEALGDAKNGLNELREAITYEPEE